MAKKKSNLLKTKTSNLLAAAMVFILAILLVFYWQKKPVKTEQIAESYPQSQTAQIYFESDLNNNWLIGETQLIDLIIDTGDDAYTLSGFKLTAEANNDLEIQQVDNPVSLTPDINPVFVEIKKTASTNSFELVYLIKEPANNLPAKIKISLQILKPTAGSAQIIISENHQLIGPNINPENINYEAQITNGDFVFSESSPSPSPSPTADPCALHSQGDADCDGLIDQNDYLIWKCEYTDPSCNLGPNNTGLDTDFNNDFAVSLIDYEIWRSNKQ